MYTIYFNTVFVCLLVRIRHLKIHMEKLLAKMEAQADTLCFLAQPKEGQDNNQFKNKKQPELLEN